MLTDDILFMSRLYSFNWIPLTNSVPSYGLSCILNAKYFRGNLIIHNIKHDNNITFVLQIDKLPLQVLMIYPHEPLLVAWQCLVFMYVVLYSPYCLFNKTFAYMHIDVSKAK